MITEQQPVIDQEKVDKVIADAENIAYLIACHQTLMNTLTPFEVSALRQQWKAKLQPDTEL